VADAPPVARREITPPLVPPGHFAGCSATPLYPEEPGDPEGDGEMPTPRSSPKEKTTRKGFIHRRRNQSRILSEIQRVGI
jgi:hypothetical protein